MQDYRTWLEQDLLDVAMPMIYLSAANDHIYFDANLANTLAIPTNSRVAPTLASYMHVNAGGGGVALTLSQMQRAYVGFGNGGTDGINFYDYPAFFNGYTAGERAQIKDFFDSLEPPPPPPPPGPGNVIDDFEVNEGHFGTVYNHSPLSQTFGLSASTTIDRVTTEAQTGDGSQLLSLVSDGSANWALRHNSGIGSVAAPAGNTPLEPNGWVGFWLKTDAAGITAQIAVDDPTTTSGTGSTALEKGIPLSVVGDNAWHLYQWNLDDGAHWNAFAGGADGDIDATFGTITIDSIFFGGSGSVQMYLDNVSHNPDAMLAAAPVPGDYDGNGVVDGGDYNRWRATFGQTVAAGTGADGDGNGTVDAGDYSIWRDNMAAVGSVGNLAAVPEPAAWGLCVAIAVSVAARKRRRLT
jgi:hypothetical protein